MKHTKGNWYYQPTIARKKNGTPLFFDIYVNGVNGGIASVRKNKYIKVSIEEAEANAKLIAAAPELLESLVQLTEAIIKIKAIGVKYGKQNLTVRVNKALEAIKKATE